MAIGAVCALAGCAAEPPPGQADLNALAQSELGCIARMVAFARPAAPAAAIPDAAQDGIEAGAAGVSKCFKRLKLNEAREVPYETLFEDADALDRGALASAPDPVLLLVHRKLALGESRLYGLAYYENYPESLLVSSFVAAEAAARAGPPRKFYLMRVPATGAQRAAGGHETEYVPNLYVFVGF